MASRAWWPIGALAVALAACGRADPPEPRPSVSASSVRGELIAPVAAAPLQAPSPTPSASASPAVAATPTLPVSYPPRDECSRQPGFRAFRDKLFAAVKAKDADAIVALADPAIHLDFGGGAGTDELRKRLSDPKSGLWGEIAQLSGLGCAADRGVATLPWIFARLPEGFDDATTAMYGTGPQLVLRKTPSASGRPLATLTWPVVELEGKGFDPQAKFARVRLSDGTVGYLETAQLRSLLDYRLVAERQGGAWKITALVAGD